MSETKKRFYTWEEFLPDVYQRIIPQLLPRAKEFSGVLGLPRGGLNMAVIISHQLEIPLVLWGIPDPTIPDDAVAAEKRGAPYQSHMTVYVSSWPMDPRILIVDEIADTGHRLFPYKNHFIVTLFYHRQSIVIPNIWLHEKKDDEWIVFPPEKG